MPEQTDYDSDIFNQLPDDRLAHIKALQKQFKAFQDELRAFQGAESVIGMCINGFSTRSRTFGNQTSCEPRLEEKLTAIERKIPLALE